MKIVNGQPQIMIDGKPQNITVNNITVHNVHDHHDKRSEHHGDQRSAHKAANAPKLRAAGHQPPHRQRPFSQAAQQKANIVMQAARGSESEKRC